jgi:XTP/dITP diphosphohydrolase
VKLTVVTSNPHKAEEIAAFFGNEIDIGHVSLELPEYRSDDVGEIARRKAEYAYSLIKKSLIVDDTAFSVDALKGFPGPYAAYVQSTIGNAGILKLMDGMHDRSAHFETVIALATKDGILLFRGRVEGEIVVAPRGRQGFGYDPIFDVGGHTLAELSLDKKNTLSHRAMALSKLRAWFIGDSGQAGTKPLSD